MPQYIYEAFQELEEIKEAMGGTTFNLDREGAAGLKEFLADDAVTESDAVTLIDPSAKTQEDLKDSYANYIICECQACGNRLVKAVEDIVADEKAGVVNLDEECPRCLSKCGYKIVGRIKNEGKVEMEPGEEDYEDKEPLESDVEADDDVEDIDTSAIGEIEGEEEEAEPEKAPETQSIKLTVKDVTNNGEDAEAEETEIYPIEVGYVIEKDKKATYIETNEVEYLAEMPIEDVVAELEGTEEVKFITAEAIDTSDEEAAAANVAINISMITDINEDEEGNAVIEPVSGLTLVLEMSPDDLQEEIDKATSTEEEKDEDAESKEEGEKSSEEESTEVEEAYDAFTSNRSYRRSREEYRDQRRPSMAQTLLGRDYLEDRFNEDRQARRRGVTYRHTATESIQYPSRRPSELRRSPATRVDLQREERRERATEAMRGRASGISLSRHPSTAKSRYSFGERLLRDTNSKSEVTCEKSADDKYDIITLSASKFSELNEALDIAYKYTDRGVIVESGKNQQYSNPYYVNIKIPKEESTIKEAYAGIAVDTGKGEIEIKQDDRGIAHISITDQAPTEAEVTEDELLGNVPEEGKGSGEKGSREDVVADIDEKTKAEIESGDVEAEVDEIVEEEFDYLGESYLKRVYQDVKSFKTTRGYSAPNGIILEGLITFNSGKVKPTMFTFTPLSVTKRGKYKFLGENKGISKKKDAYTLTGTIKGNRLMMESLTYNYNVPSKSTGKAVHVYDTIHLKK